MRPGTLRLISIYLVSYRRSGLTVCHHVVCVHRTVLLFIWLQVRRSVSSLERTSSRDLSADLAATGAATVRGPSPPHGRVQRRRALTFSEGHSQGMSRSPATDSLPASASRRHHHRHPHTAAPTAQQVFSGGRSVGAHYRMDEANVLGVGGSSRVFAGWDDAAGRAVAVKVMNRREIDGHARLVQLLEREINISLRLCHPGIVQLLDVIFESESVLLVLELCEGGDLLTSVQTSGALNIREARGVLRQCIEAMSYCHAQQIYHRDLKPENICIVRGDSRESAAAGVGDVKIADFGLAKDLEAHAAGPMTTMCGTIAFMAPEVMDTRSHSPDYCGAAVDCWGLGCVLYMITTGCFPFGTDGPRRTGGLAPHEVFRNIQRGAAGIDFSAAVRQSETLPSEVIEAVQGLLQSDVSLRWTLAQFAACPFVQGEDGFLLGQSTRRTRVQAHHGTGTDPEEGIAAQVGASAPSPSSGLSTTIPATGSMQGQRPTEIRWPVAPPAASPPLRLDAEDLGVNIDLALEWDDSTMGFSSDLNLSLDDDDDELRLNDDALDLGLNQEWPPDETPSQSREDAPPSPPPPLLSPTTVATATAAAVDPPPATVRFFTAQETLQLRPRRTRERPAVNRTASHDQDPGQDQARAVATVALEPAPEVQPQQEEEEAEEQQQQQQCEAAVPEGLSCPITGLLLNDPVVCCDGHTYERAAISRWFAQRRSQGLELTSPLTNVELGTDMLLPNHALRKQCESFRSATQPFHMY